MSTSHGRAFWGAAAALLAMVAVALCVFGASFVTINAILVMLAAVEG
jgi:hypothetical protein